MATRRTSSTKSKSGNPLKIELLRRKCDPKKFSFKTTAELEPAEGLIGQDRALDALAFGVELNAKGYNIFALGAPESGKHNATRDFLKKHAAAQKTPKDWVYVHNFAVPYQPVALSLPSGRGPELAEKMDNLIEGLHTAMPAVFDSDDYQERRKKIEQKFREQRDAAFKQLSDEAASKGLGIMRTETGFAIVPVKENEPLSQQEFAELPEKERETLEAHINEMQTKLAESLENVPKLDKERRDTFQKLHRELAGVAVKQAMNDLSSSFKSVDGVADYLSAVKQDLVSNARMFVEQAETQGEGQSSGGRSQGQEDARFKKYQVNVLVCHKHGECGDGGAPVIYDDRPELGHLLGRIEHVPQMGGLVTDFTLIKPGTLHKANGGYLLIDARRLLGQPSAWEGLKRSLRSQSIAIESPFAHAATAATITLEPDPIPLDIKVVLFGDRQIYYLLSQADPDFAALFKVAADFDEIIERGEEEELLFARLLAGIAQREDLRPLEPSAVAAVVEHSSRMTSDSDRLSIRIGHIADLLREANHWAGKKRRGKIIARDVEQAVEEQVHRIDRIRDRMHEQITRESVLIDTDGDEIGQINGLAVLGVGNFSFGKPSRITAKTRMGTGDVVDIEREVELGGPLHTKGVLILSSFISSRYALDVPLSLSASLVFEQSYGGVDGDSASSTELYALLSSLSGIPIHQGLAVTGSVNQHGEIQVIGGVNEKIEGFFDICNAAGLTGTQGVLIPEGNVKNLMLRQDVVNACKKNKFHIYSVSHIDQGIEILTGTKAGNRGKNGLFPKDTINRLVEETLQNFADQRRSFLGATGIS